MNRNSRIALPGWLDARTIAMLSAFIALGAMTQTSMGAMEQRLREDMAAMEQRLRDDMGTMEQRLRQGIANVSIAGNDGRTRLARDIGKLDERLRKVEVGVAEIQVGMGGFDARLAAVEQHAQPHSRPDGPDLP